MLWPNEKHIIFFFVFGRSLRVQRKDRCLCYSVESVRTNSRTQATLKNKAHRKRWTLNNEKKIKQLCRFWWQQRTQPKKVKWALLLCARQTGKKGKVNGALDSEPNHHTRTVNTDWSLEPISVKHCRLCDGGSLLRCVCWSVRCASWPVAALLSCIWCECVGVFQLVWVCVSEWSCISDFTK